MVDGIRRRGKPRSIRKKEVAEHVEQRSTSLREPEKVDRDGNKWRVITC